MRVSPPGPSLSHSGSAAAAAEAANSNRAAVRILKKHERSMGSPGSPKRSTLPSGQGAGNRGKSLGTFADLPATRREQEPTAQNRGRPDVPASGIQDFQDPGVFLFLRQDRVA